MNFLTSRNTLVTMEGGLADNILSVCKALNKFSVEYMIVGGTAVALHGYFRRSINMAGGEAEKPDLDFWYNPTHGNYFKLLDALEELDQDVSRFKKEQAPNPKKSFFRFEFENFTLDFLPELASPLKFRSAFKKRETARLQDAEIPFINYEDLITDKQGNARSKDIRDMGELQMKRKEDEEKKK